MRLLAVVLCWGAVGAVWLTLTLSFCWLTLSFCRLAIAIEELAKASSLLQDKLQVRISSAISLTHV